MGRISEHLSKVRSAEELELAADISKFKARIEAISGQSSTVAKGASEVQVFKEPFFKVLKGTTSLGSSSFFQNYHTRYIKTGSSWPVFHMMLFVGAVGYCLDFQFHLKHQRHGAKDAHGH